MLSINTIYIRHAMYNIKQLIYMIPRLQYYILIRQIGTGID